MGLKVYHTYTSGSNIFLIFRQGVGLIIGGFTAHWKFSKAEKIENYTLSKKEKKHKGPKGHFFVSTFLLFYVHI
jgi:hypothetical protein